MSKCKQCNEDLVTASFDGALPFTPDSEPYKSSVKEDVDFEIEEEISIGILWCETHGVQSAWVNDAKPNTFSHADSIG